MFLLAIPLCLAAQEAEFIPLKAGASWSYRTSTGQTLEVRVRGTSAVGSQACTLLETAVGPQVTQEHVAVTREGFTAFKVENAFGSLEYPTPILRARLPFKAGDAWTVRLQEGAQVNEYQYRTEGSEQVTVPAGTFEAWKVSGSLRGPPGPAVMTIWYGKGIGLVKQVYDVNGQAMTAELTASSLIAKPAPDPKPGPRLCPKCAAEDKAGGKFCAECGAPLGPPPPPK
jgi:hypothetical protein